MMRWNSTRTYTEDDMIRMQQEAVNRVQEFQTRARQAVPFYDVPESAIIPYNDPQPEPMLFSPSAQQLPPPAPDAGEPPQEGESFFAQAPLDESQVPVPVPEQPEKTSIAEDPIRGLLEKFDLDPDITLILGLIFLLHNEKADNLLLLALGYLLL